MFDTKISVQPWQMPWFWTTKLILRETEYVTLLLLYLWATYEPIRLNFTGKTVIFCVYWFWTAIYYFQLAKKNQCFDSKIQLYGLVFSPQVEKKKWEILCSLWNLFCCSKLREKWAFRLAKHHLQRKYELKQPTFTANKAIFV